MKIQLFLLLVIFYFANGTPLKRTKTAPPTNDTINYRLPAIVLPNHYFLLIHLDFTTFVSVGYVEINFNLVNATKNITFHAKNIDFLATQFVNRTANFKIAKEEFDYVRDFRIIHFSNTIYPGEYTLKVNYTGYMSESHSRGFLKRHYVDAKGVKHWLAVTHFEPTYARLAFPCFDEPALKANFTVHIRRPSNYNSISNMPLTKTIITNAYHEDVFDTSVKMSTYLVAFAISDYKNVSQERHRVFAQPDAIIAGDGDIALDFGIKTLKALEEYTKIQFSLPKMDQIAIPELPSGAMENWGLVTYKDYNLLHNTTFDVLSAKQSVLNIIAHEFSHQWFGNLVSPHWWNYIWLNEGFAKYYASYISNMVKPQWRVNDQYVRDTCQNIFEFDSTQRTRPMTSNAESPYEIANLFDGIAYSKSGCVLRMLQQAITDKVFRDGINRYLIERQYNAAKSSDLWNNIQKAANQANLNLSISKIMSTWEHQKGYPLVTVTRNYSTGIAILTQKHYLEDASLQSDNSQWFIPVSYATNKQLNFNDTSATHWIVPNRSLILNVSSSDWLLINKQQSGYYRVNYDDKNWNMLADYLNTTNFDNIDSVSRSQLINDAFSFAYSKRLKYSVALQLTKYLHRETDYIPLSVFFRELDLPDYFATAAANYKLFEQHIANVLDRSFKSLGIKEVSSDDKDFVDNKNRVNVVKYACKYGNQNCWNKATGALENVRNVSLLMRSTLFCVGLRGANEAVWNRIYNQSINDPDSLLRNQLSVALGCSYNPNILTKYIELGLEINKSYFSNVYSSGNYGRQFSFEYLLKNFEKIYQKLSQETASVITGITNKLNTQEQLEKLVDLQTSNKHKELNKCFKDAVDTVKSNIEITNKYVGDIYSWIDRELGKKVSH